MHIYFLRGTLTLKLSVHPNPGARVELHVKEGELRAAYDRLADGARERADVRAALVSTQTELAHARAELEVWSQADLIERQSANAADVRPYSPNNLTLTFLRRHDRKYSLPLIRNCICGRWPRSSVNAIALRQRVRHVFTTQPPPSPYPSQKKTTLQD